MTVRSPSGAASVGLQEASVRALAETLSSLIALLQGDTLTYVNPAGCALLGRPRDFLVGRHFSGLFHLDDRAGAMVRGPVRHAGLARCERSVERHVRADGRTIWVEYALDPVQLDGRPATLVTGHDVTDRKRVEAELRKSEERVRLAFTHAAVAKGVLALDRRILQVNPAACRMFGYTEAELLARTTRDITHPDDLEKSDALARRLLEGGEASGAIEKRFLHKDGRTVWVSGTTAVVRDPGGRPLYFIIEGQDITEQKRAEAALKESEERFRRMADAIPEVIWITGLQPERVLYASPSFERIWGLPVGDLYRNPRLWTETIHPEDRVRVVSTFSRWIAGEEVSYLDVEFRIVRPNGDTRWVHERGALSLDQEGKPYRASGIATDITERKRADEALRRSEAYLAEAQRLSLTGSFGWNVSTGAVVWSEETFRITGTDRGTQPTLDLMLERTHPEDVALVRQAIERASRDGTDLDLEHRLSLPDGSVKHVHVWAHAVRDESSGGLEYLGAVMDVTATKQSQQALERAFEEIQALKDQLQKENIALRDEIDKTSMFEEIVGSSEPLRRVLRQVARVAPMDSTVLILGETGTGKELIARAIHRRSHRSARAFIRVNCPAVPPSLIASELFGHERGAFTGAVQRRQGRFELAEGGTVFLDEVGELPAETQLALLRVLQEREFERVGGSRPIRADVRVIAATNRDLQAAVAAHAFRADLFYRLSVFPLELPPLRDRRADIPLLVEYFIHRYARRAGKKIRGVSREALDLLQSYPWPGNIRELQNVIERAVIVSDTETLSVDGAWLAGRSREQDLVSPPLGDDLVAHEKARIEAALTESRGRVSGPSGAAARLGVPRSTLESKIRSLRINKHRFKAS